MEDLTALRDNIENLEKHQHLHIVKIIQKNNIDFTENRNGIFLNMKDLNKETIKEILQYLKYIAIQQNNLTQMKILKKLMLMIFLTIIKRKECNIIPCQKLIINLKILYIRQMIYRILCLLEKI